MTYLESFTKILEVIENTQEEKPSIQALADVAFISTSHLQRLFKQLTGQSLMSYVRGRRLTQSLNELFSSDMRIIDIANEYGFKHEQSYIRAFREEFNCTPNKARKDKCVLPIRERISPNNLYNMQRGLMYGPEHVIVPDLFMIGKPVIFHDFDDDRDALLPNMAGQKNIYEVVASVKNPLHPEVYLALATHIKDRDYEYMPGTEVESLKHIPSGMKGFHFPMLHCLCFRYVGQHRLEEINMITAQETYNAINHFFYNQTRYIRSKNYHLERIDSLLYDGVFCQMELLIPVKDTF